MLNISSPRGHWKWNQFHTSVKCQLPWRPVGVMWLFYIYRVSKERVRPSLWGQREGHARNRTCSLCFHVHVFLLKAAMLLCGNSLCVHGRIRVLLCVINLAPGDFFALRMDEIACLDHVLWRRANRISVTTDRRLKGNHPSIYSLCFSQNWSKCLIKWIGRCKALIWMCVKLVINAFDGEYSIKLKEMCAAVVFNCALVSLKHFSIKLLQRIRAYMSTNWGY